MKIILDFIYLAPTSIPPMSQGYQDYWWPPNWPPIIGHPATESTCYLRIGDPQSSVTPSPTLQVAARGWASVAGHLCLRRYLFAAALSFDGALPCRCSFAPVYLRCLVFCGCPSVDGVVGAPLWRRFHLLAIHAMGRRWCYVQQFCVTNFMVRVRSTTPRPVLTSTPSFQVLHIEPRVLLERRLVEHFCHQLATQRSPAPRASLLPCPCAHSLLTKPHLLPPPP